MQMRERSSKEKMNDGDDGVHCDCGYYDDDCSLMRSHMITYLLQEVCAEKRDDCGLKI